MEKRGPLPKRLIVTRIEDGDSYTREVDLGMGYHYAVATVPGFLISNGFFSTFVSDPELEAAILALALTKPPVGLERGGHEDPQEDLMAVKFTQANAKKAIKYIDMVYKFISTGIAEVIIPDRIEKYVKFVRDVLVEALKKAPLK